MATPYHSKFATLPIRDTRHFVTLPIYPSREFATLPLLDDIYYISYTCILLNVDVNLEFLDNAFLSIVT